MFLLDRKMYESAGLNDKSKIRVYDLSTGKTTQTVVLPKLFGEGISVINNKLYQLTWKSYKVFVYDYPSLNKTGELSWPSKAGA